MHGHRSSGSHGSSGIVVSEKSMPQTIPHANTVPAGLCEGTTDTRRSISWNTGSTGNYARKCMEAFY